MVMEEEAEKMHTIDTFLHVDHKLMAIHLYRNK